jgi:hypothetical protein
MLALYANSMQFTHVVYTLLKNTWNGILHARLLTGALLGSGHGICTWLFLHSALLKRHQFLGVRVPCIPLLDCLAALFRQLDRCAEPSYCADLLLAVQRAMHILLAPPHDLDKTTAPVQRLQ